MAAARTGLQACGLAGVAITGSASKAITIFTQSTGSMRSRQVLIIEWETPKARQGCFDGMQSVFWAGRHSYAGPDPALNLETPYVLGGPPAPGRGRLPSGPARRPRPSPHTVPSLQWVSARLGASQQFGAFGLEFASVAATSINHVRRNPYLAPPYIHLANNRIPGTRRPP
jgi:hypothetical protein